MNKVVAGGGKILRYDASMLSHLCLFMVYGGQEIQPYFKNAKFQEGPFQKIWAEIQDWAYEGSKMTQAAEKVRNSSILQYPNAPLMASFGGTKEAAVKFIISRYHNG